MTWEKCSGCGLWRPQSELSRVFDGEASVRRCPDCVGRIRASLRDENLVVSDWNVDLHRPAVLVLSNEVDLLDAFDGEDPSNYDWEFHDRFEERPNTHDLPLSKEEMEEEGKALESASHLYIQEKWPLLRIAPDKYFEDSYVAFWEALLPVVKMIATTYRLDDGERDEVHQEAMMRILCWLRKHGARDGDDAWSHLIKLAVFTMRNWLRREGYTHKEGRPVLLRWGDLAGLGEHPDLVVHDDFADGRMVDILRAVSDAQHGALLVYAALGLTDAEIAAEVGLTPRAVEGRRQRAGRELRDLLKS